MLELSSMMSVSLDIVDREVRVHIRLSWPYEVLSFADILLQT